MNQPAAQYKYKNGANTLHSEPVDLIETAPGLYVPVPVSPAEIIAVDEYRRRRDAVPAESKSRPRTSQQKANAEFRLQLLVNTVIWLAVLSGCCVVGYALVTFVIGAVSGILSVAETVGRWIAYGAGLVFAFALLGVILSSLRRGKDDATEKTAAGAPQITQIVYYQNQTK